MKIPVLLLLAGCAVLFPACGGKASKSATPVMPKPIADATPTMIAKLEKADAADGKVDMVVSKCAGCLLGMDGKPEHAVKVGAYTLQFCDHCAGLVADPAKAIDGLKN